MESISPYILPVLIGLVVIISIFLFLKFKLKKKKSVFIGPLGPEKESQAMIVSEHIASYLQQGFDIKEMRLQAAAQEIDMDIWERAEEIVALSISNK